MKISYRTHPVLEMLETDNPLIRIDSRLPNLDEVGQRFLSVWKKNRHIYKRNINLITEPFAEAVKRSAGKVIDLYKELDWPLSGTLIIKNMAFCYDCNQGEINGKPAIFVNLVVFTYSNALDTLVDGDFIYASQASFDDLSVDNKIDAVKVHWSFIQACLLFKQFAEVETKQLPPKSRKVDIDCKYINDTASNVTLLDSKWFTNLVKSDAFTVRGHFRLQPHGEGRQARKLIWINDFEKSGYTAPARKLKAGNETV